MFDTIRAILETPPGSFAFVFGMMVLAGWVIHYVTKFTVTISSKHDRFNERMDKTESDIAEIRTDVAEMKGLLLDRFFKENVIALDAVDLHDPNKP